MINVSQPSPALRLPLATTAARPHRTLSTFSVIIHMMLKQHGGSCAPGAIVVLPITDSDMPDLDQLMKTIQRPSHGLCRCDPGAFLPSESHCPRSARSTIRISETYRIVGRRKFRVVPPTLTAES